MKSAFAPTVSTLLAAGLTLSMAVCTVTADDAAPTPATKSIPAIPLMKPVDPATQAANGSKAAPDTIDTKAKAIHDRGLDSVKKLKGLELVSDLKVEGIDPAMLPPGITGPSRVVLDFKSEGGPAPFGRFVIESMKSGKPESRFAFDGTNSIAVDDAQKAYMVGGKQWFEVLGQRAAVLPQWFLENRMDMAALGASPDEMPKLVGLTVVGEETIDGTPCDVVRAVRSMKLDGMEGEDGKPMPAREMRITETIAFARADGLPRRVASVTEVPGEEAMAGMSTSTTFTGVKADPTLDDKTFSTAGPAGYKKMEPAAAAEEKGPELKVKVGDAAPEFKLMTTDDKEVTLASLKGKVVLLDFWATWCGPCKAAMPSIQKIHDEYKNKGVAVFGVNCWERKDGVGKKYMTDKGYTYGCLLAGDDLASKQYGTSGIPTLVVIGKDGKIALLEVGFGPEGDKKIREAIELALTAK